MLLEEFQAVVATAETDGVCALLASGTLKATDKIVQSSIRTLYGMKDAICANDAICGDLVLYLVPFLACCTNGYWADL
eukprot:505432-Karenia_brevis.AAC.1